MMADVNIDSEMVEEAVHPKEEENEEILEDDDENEEDINPEEYQMLDAKLDDLNIALDLIEQKNDNIRAEFLKLLHSNQQIREELKQQKMMEKLDPENPSEGAS